MPNYQDGRIYTVRCRKDDTLIYVGSTTQPLAKRWGEHKKASRTEKCQNRLIYKTINGNWTDWFIELYEVYPCENKEQLNRREGEIIREIGSLNITVAGRTSKEYYQDYREEIIETVSQYYINNKEACKERSKNYREEHLETIRLYDKKRLQSEKRKEYMKKFREEHREELLAKKLAYYHQVLSKNKEYINMKQRENYAKRKAKKTDIEALNSV
jgi:hypothetical protein